LPVLRAIQLPMNRINAKGLLIENADGLYQDTITKLFRESKLSRADFQEKLTAKKEEIDEQFGETLAAGYAENYTIKFRKYHKNILDVQKAIARIYEAPFTGYFSYLSTCHVILNNLFKQLDASVTNETDVVVISLYGHLLRKADQIGILLLNGYEDAAMIIWRAFFEFAITLKVLAEQNNEQLTRKFVRHQIHRSNRLRESYHKRLVPEGFDALTDEEIRLSNAEMDQLIADYGKSIAEGEYGWAEGIPGLKARPTLINLEELVNLGRYRPYYIFASGYTHANFAVFDKINENGTMRIERIKEIQPELDDFVDPMQITLAVLEDVNAALMGLISDDDEAQLNLDVLNNLYMELIAFFQENNDDPDARGSTRPDL
jgi:hypothetical protein